jgi:hypothetical protein
MNIIAVQATFAAVIPHSVESVSIESRIILQTEKS